MYDIITIGSATRDVFVKSDLSKIIRIRDILREKELLCFDYGAKINVNEIFFTTGGGATNAAVSLARQGMKVACLCVVGRDSTGDEIVRMFEDEGVDPSFVVRDGERSTGYSVVINSFEGDRTVLTYRGANHFLTPRRVDWDALRGARWVYLTSLTGSSTELLLPLADFCEERGVKLAWNPGSVQIGQGMEKLARTLRSTEVLLLNRTEAARFVGVDSARRYVDEKLCTLCRACVETCPHEIFQVRGEKVVVTDEERCTRCGECVRVCPTRALLIEPWALNTDEILLRLKSAGAGLVVVTDGGRGAQAYDGRARYLFPSYPAQVFDTLGAGDAFGSTFVGELIRSGGIEGALRAGAANASGVVSKFGAKTGLMKLEEIEAFIGKRESEETRVRRKTLVRPG